MTILFAFALFLTPPSHEVAQPGSVSFSWTEPTPVHTRWKSNAASGTWVPPTLTLSKPGTYWISAATKPRLKRYQPAEIEAHGQREGLDLILDYRKKYKMQSKPVRLLESTYAKTMLRIGSQKEDTSSLLLHLPVEIVLRYPTLIQLNFRGQPLAGIPIIVNGKRLGLTNGAGQLPLGEGKGKMEISASVVRAYPDHTTADWEVFTATLTLPELSAR